MGAPMCEEPGAAGKTGILRRALRGAPSAGSTDREARRRAAGARFGAARQARK